MDISSAAAPQPSDMGDVQRQFRREAFLFRAATRLNQAPNLRHEAAYLPQVEASGARVTAAAALPPHGAEAATLAGGLAQQQPSGAAAAPAAAEGDAAAPARARAAPAQPAEHLLAFVSAAAAPAASPAASAVAHSAEQLLSPATDALVAEERPAVFSFACSAAQAPERPAAPPGAAHPTFKGFQAGLHQLAGPVLAERTPTRQVGNGCGNVEARRADGQAAGLGWGFHDTAAALASLPRQAVVGGRQAGEDAPAEAESARARASPRQRSPYLLRRPQAPAPRAGAAAGAPRTRLGGTHAAVPAAVRCAARRALVGGAAGPVPAGGRGSMENLGASAASERRESEPARVQAVRRLLEPRNGVAHAWGAGRAQLGTKVCGPHPDPKPGGAPAAAETAVASRMPGAPEVARRVDSTGLIARRTSTCSSTISSRGTGEPVTKRATLPGAGPGGMRGTLALRQPVWGTPESKLPCASSRTGAPVLLGNRSAVLRPEHAATAVCSGRRSGLGSGLGSLPAATASTKLAAAAARGGPRSGLGAGPGSRPGGRCALAGQRERFAAAGGRRPGGSAAAGAPPESACSPASDSPPRTQALALPAHLLVRPAATAAPAELPPLDLAVPLQAVLSQPRAASDAAAGAPLLAEGPAEGLGGSTLVTLPVGAVVTQALLPAEGPVCAPMGSMTETGGSREAFAMRTGGSLCVSVATAKGRSSAGWRRVVCRLAPALPPHFVAVSAAGGSSGATGTPAARTMVEARLGLLVDRRAYAFDEARAELFALFSSKHAGAAVDVVAPALHSSRSGCCGPRIDPNPRIRAGVPAVSREALLAQAVPEAAAAQRRGASRGRASTNFCIVTC